MAKRKLLNLRVIGNSEELLSKFINKNKAYIFKETYAGIKHAIRQNKSIAEICNVNTNSATATIPKKGWENALSSSLGYFESIDEFETCRDINITLKTLRNVRPTSISKTVSGSVITS
tara:strand:+ start:672 stop:1025 length:354 start_codon:yes stop_codon:yes gene_type:complete